jgi:glycine cleavage system T protein
MTEHVSAVPERARIVIIGAGIAGASLAFHLARLGTRDVVVLDAGDVIGGTTAHAPGLVGQLRASVSLTRMLMDSVALYRTLRCDADPGFDQVGSLRLASSRERWEELQRQAAFALGVGLEAHLIGPAEAIAMAPLMSADELQGALYLPGDGSARAPILAGSLIAAAREEGISVCPHTPVVGFDVVGERVRAVQMPGGRIEAETVVITAGIWSPLIARLAGVSLPLTPMQHQYVVSDSIEGLAARRMPNVRDPDRLVYLRQDGASLVVGGYERNPRPEGMETLATGRESTIRPFDWEHFAPLWQAAIDRCPALISAGWKRGVNGLESFTPDGEFLLGPIPEVKGLWAACGFCAHGVSGAGGVGKVMAEWIVEGEPSLDLWHMDLRRFSSYSASRRYTVQRASEIYSTYYDISYPGRERSSARQLRLSPLYAQLTALGAEFGEKAGWERPNWFRSNEGRVPVEHPPRGWPARYWSPAIAAEHEATRTAAALFDETSFSKIEVVGPGALPLLQRLAANEMDRPVGSTTYTQMLNERGGIECDLTVTRLAGDRFQIITGTAFGAHDLAWIRQHMPDDGSVHAQDVTGSRCCIGLWGPRAREVLGAVCDDDLSNQGFPYLTARQITVGQVPVLALRVTYVGELGWELYASTEYGHALWATLWAAGQNYGIVPAGYRAIDSLRLEKGYRYWSADIHGEYNPYEAGLGFAVRLDKEEFIGRTALIQARERGPRRKLCCLILDDPTAVVLGGEPVLDGSAVVGRVTSGGYGYTVEKSIAYGYLPVGLSAPGSRLQVQWFGERVGVEVVREPLYDPKNQRIKDLPTGTHLAHSSS